MDSQKKFLPKLYPLTKEIEKTWFVQFTGKDGRRKKLYGELNNLPTLEERITEADKLFAQVYAGDLMQPAHGIGNQLIKDLQAVYDLRTPAWSKKTCAAFQTHFFQFAVWYRAEGCPSMDVLRAVQFLNTITARGNNNTTRNNYRNKLKSLFGSLRVYFKQRYTENCFAEAPLLGQREKTKEWFRPEQVAQVRDILQEKDPELLLAVKIMFHCYARPNEIRQLQVSNIIWDTRKLRIESKISKTIFVRHVPIPDSLFDNLQFLRNQPRHFYIFGLNGRPGTMPVSRDNLSKRHKENLVLLKYGPGFTFYGWKNTGAVKMLCHDKRNIRYISKCMGHHSLDMTDRYFESLGVDEADTILFPVM